MNIHMLTGAPLQSKLPHPSLVAQKPSWAGGPELSQEQVSACYHSAGVFILKNALFPEQRTRKAYQLREGAKLTNGQRSFVDSLLRKYLGNKKVAIHMFQHGLPRLLDPPGARPRVPATEQRDHSAIATDLVEALAETSDWFVALACAIYAYEQQPELERQRLLATPRHQRRPADQREERARRNRQAEAVEQIAWAGTS